MTSSPPRSSHPADMPGWELFYTPGPGHGTDPPSSPVPEPLSPDPTRLTPTRPDLSPAFTCPLIPTRLISSIRSRSPDQSDPDQRHGTPDPDPTPDSPCITNPRPWSPPNKYRLGEERGWTKKKLTPPDL